LPSVVVKGSWENDCVRQTKCKNSSFMIRISNDY
jgi:hypothetical protein